MQMNRVNRIVLSTIVLLAMNVKGGETTAKSRSSSVRRFTLEEAVLTALQQNPTILIARQEIERTKGLFIEMRAAALPQINANALFQDIDPHIVNTGGGIQNTIPGVTSGNLTNSTRAERSYSLDIIASQVMFSGGRVPGQISSASFQRDSSYYSFRNVIDLIVATVREQFYLVLLDRALIGVQEESVRLLQSQLQDQQNRFEAGTVPRFNVLQAQVALQNQIPLLITAQNNYRISQLQLAKTLGLDFDPRRGDSAPLEAVGELVYTPREIQITQAIALAKANRPFLKQQKATVLSNNSQVGVARSGYFPQINATAGAEGRSSLLTDNIRAARTGYIFGATGSWAIWDWGATFGRVKQARAILEESKNTLDDDVRQVELEVQQAYSNLQQNRELIKSQEKNVEEAEEALRLAKARLDAGAGVQLDVLNAQVQLLTAQSTRLQALYGYSSSLAEFDRATATEVKYSACVDEPRTRSKLRTAAKPTPAPKPTPLPLNGDCAATKTTRTKVESSLAK
jgi:outer membrane protein TolC